MTVKETAVIIQDIRRELDKTYTEDMVLQLFKKIAKKYNVSIVENTIDCGCCKIIAYGKKDIPMEWSVNVQGDYEIMSLYCKFLNNKGISESQENAITIVRKVSHLRSTD